MGRDLTLTSRGAGGDATACGKQQSQSLSESEDRVLPVSLTGMTGQRLRGAWAVAAWVIVTLQAFRCCSMLTSLALSQFRQGGVVAWSTRVR